MNKKELLDFHCIKPSSIKRQGEVSIVSDEDRKYVLKKRTRKADTFDYLMTRNFNNFPKIYSSIEDDYDLVDYITDFDTPKEQKLQDIVYLDSMLHAKTTFYKNVDDDYIKAIYEDFISRVNYLEHYYHQLQDLIEIEVYMSPANYLLIRNMSMIYLALKKARSYIEKWYSIIKDKKRFRYAFIHGNLEENHLIENDDLYFISWDKARIDLPVYDIEIFYRKSYMDISLNEIMEIYSSKYSLEKEEKYFLYAVTLMPEKLDLEKDEYSKIKQVTEIVFYLDRVLTYLENNTKESYQNTKH